MVSKDVADTDSDVDDLASLDDNALLPHLRPSEPPPSPCAAVVVGAVIVIADAACGAVQSRPARRASAARASSAALTALYARVSPSLPMTPTSDAPRASSAGGLLLTPSSKRRGRRTGTRLSGRVMASPQSRYGQWAGVRDSRDDDESEFLRRLLEEDDDGTRRPRSIFTTQDYDFWDFEREMQRREEKERRKAEKEERRCPVLGEGTVGITGLLGQEAAAENADCYERLVASGWRKQKSSLLVRIDQQRRDAQRRRQRLLRSPDELRMEAREAVQQRRQEERLRRVEKEAEAEKQNARAARAAQLEAGALRDANAKIKDELQEIERRRLAAARQSRQEQYESRIRREQEREELLRELVYERHLRTRSDRHQLMKERALHLAERHEMLEQERTARIDQRERSMAQVAADAERRIAAAQDSRRKREDLERQRKEDRTVWTSALQREVEASRQGRKLARQKRSETALESRQNAALADREARKAIIKEAIDKREARVRSRHGEILMLLEERRAKSKTPSALRPLSH